MRFVPAALLLMAGLATGSEGSTPSAPVSPASARFEVAAPSLRTDRYLALARDFARDDPLQRIARELDAAILVPATITLRYSECGEPNAFYDPSLRTITLCFEMVEQLAEDFAAQLHDDADLAEAVSGAYSFIVLHEVGHALVDVLELPITGREEDAVDQLSAWLLIGDEAGDSAVLSAAAAFSINGDAYGLSEGDFANAHSLDQQRYFSMVCWVYGRDPARHADLVELSGLPPARAETCAEEYARLDASWRRLLGNRLKVPRPAAEPATKE